LDWRAKSLFLVEVLAASVGSFRVTDDIRVLLGEEGHSGSHFFLIFSDYRSQE
jgi:hypothetical protein